jgi:hypothetical protein
LCDVLTLFTLAAPHLPQVVDPDAGNAKTLEFLNGSPEALLASDADDSDTDWYSA